MGSLVLQPKVGWVPEFEQYFRSLQFENKRNPWFNEYLASVFDCNGQICNNEQDLSKYAMEQVNYENIYRNIFYSNFFFWLQDPEVISIMNAVMTVSHALDSVMREVCPGKIYLLLP